MGTRDWYCVGGMSGYGFGSLSSHRLQVPGRSLTPNPSLPHPLPHPPHHQVLWLFSTPAPQALKSTSSSLRAATCWCPMTTHQCCTMGGEDPLSFFPSLPCQPPLCSGLRSLPAGFQVCLQPAGAAHHHTPLGSQCPNWPAMESEHLGHHTGPQALRLQPEWPRPPWWR